jgi:tetratricopeptide (TPR) repeat protein
VAPHDLADLRQPYEIHPTVAAAGRAQAGGDFQAGVDSVLGELWIKVVRLLADREAREPVGEHLVRAGLDGVPYLLRLNRWQEAMALLDEVLIRDHSRAAAAAALPALRAIADMAAPEQQHAVTAVLFRALKVIAPAGGEQAARAALADALGSHDYRAATALVGDLAAYYGEAGRLGEALAFTEKKIDYTRLGGYGPWTQLSALGQRLRMLADMGKAEQVLPEVRRLRKRVDTLAETSAQPENIDPWRVREALLGVGRDCAMQLGRWTEALELNAAVIHSRQGRGAPAAEIASTRFNTHGPLIRLGRLEEALDVLRECRKAFESAHNVHMLGKVLGALADVEDRRGHHQIAADLAFDALRYAYLAGHADSIQVDHHNVGIFCRLAGQLNQALAHHLAAALIGAVTGRGDNGGSLKEAAADLRAIGDTAAIPADVAELCRHVAEVPGVRLDRLLATPGRDSQTIQLELDKVIARVRALSAGTDPRLAAWDPVIAGLIAADHGSATAAALLDEWLATYGKSPDWARLAPVLGRIRDGQRHTDLLAGLDATDAAIVTRTLGALAGHVTIPGALWRAIPIAGLLGLLVAGAHGDAGAAQGARQVLGAFARDPDQIMLAHALTRILDGNNDPGLIGALEDQLDRAVVATVLHYIHEGEPGGLI